ncbi:MAG: ABC transporter permease [Phycisphaerales bacterium]
MRVFLAMLLDSYRELNSRKLFWITLILSGIVVGLFAFVGITDRGLKVFIWEIPIKVFNANFVTPATFYKLIFVNLGVSVWLAWAATILALISTAGMIPDFVAGGAIELTLSKPISRARLLLTKYVSCLLFTALQVTVFSTAAFLLIGLRGGEWIPGVFLAIPLIVTFYSYLFCVCALVGLITRSTIAALLVTLLVWFGMFAVNFVDRVMVRLRSNSELRLEEIEKTIGRMETNTRNALDAQKAPDAATETYTAQQLDAANPFLPRKRSQLVEERKALKKWAQWTDAFYIGKTVLPKTTETIDVLKRRLIAQADLEKLMPPDEDANIQKEDNDDVRVADREIMKRTEQNFRERPLWWIVGTSLGFEAVVLGIATVIFCRRDF